MSSLALRTRLIPIGYVETSSRTLALRAHLCSLTGKQRREVEKTNEQMGRKSEKRLS